MADSSSVIDSKGRERSLAFAQESAPTDIVIPTSKIQSTEHQALSPQATTSYRAIKRTFDIAFSFLVVAILFIPGLILSVLIALDSPGAPLYGQERVGRNGKPFKLLKFRTMVIDANEHPEKYLSKDQLDEWNSERKVSNDPRITRLGGWLRKTSIDELPQFLNVLFASNMSIIGPRPVVRDELSAYGNRVDTFLSVKPGITGWWQVVARNDADYASGTRQDIELYYVLHQSLGLDSLIFFKTFSAMLRKTGN